MFSISTFPVLASSERLRYGRQPHSPLVQQPCPEPNHKYDVEEIEDQRSTENDGMVAPCIVGRHADARHGYGPGEHPQEVGAEGLVEVPAGDSGEEDGSELVI
jgi:hypothetical protein